MFKQILFLLLSAWLCQRADAQCKIVVEVNNFRNSKGVCILGLFENAAAFSGNGEPIRYMKVAIRQKTATAVFDNVPPGSYAISVIHDANNNNRFDTNFIGIPTEGYGASRNKLPFAAAPKFDDNKFVLPPNTTTAINIKLRYLL